MAGITKAQKAYNDEALFNEFSKNAKYYSIPRKYMIKVGNKLLSSYDTAELFQKFIKEKKNNSTN